MAPPAIGVCTLLLLYFSLSLSLSHYTYNYLTDFLENRNHSIMPCLFRGWLVEGTKYWVHIAISIQYTHTNWQKKTSFSYLIFNCFIHNTFMAWCSMFYFSFPDVGATSVYEALNQGKWPSWQWSNIENASTKTGQNKGKSLPQGSGCHHNMT